VAQKYFPTRGNRHWVFHGYTTSATGQGQEQDRRKAASGPMRRHAKMKAAAHRYDPDWEGYFEARLGVKMEATLQGRRRLRYLWQTQDGRCPVCHQKIPPLTGWHHPHIVWRSLGGSDHAAKRVLRHPNCHRQVHNQG
jgi:RNA-directed DNA polymerase